MVIVKSAAYIMKKLETYLIVSVPDQQVGKRQRQASTGMSTGMIMDTIIKLDTDNLSGTGKHFLFN